MYMKTDLAVSNVRGPDETVHVCGKPVSYMFKIFIMVYRHYKTKKKDDIMIYFIFIHLHNLSRWSNWLVSYPLPTDALLAWL
jgi:hypothetical protein